MPLPANPGSSSIRSTKEENEAFSEIVGLIATSRERALQAVNTALIELYWKIGETISRKIEAAEWGDAVVDRLAQFIATTEPGMRGFTRRNLFRMRRFYETYRENAIVTPLVSQLPWSHHLVILEQSKRAEEREFYLRLAPFLGYIPPGFSAHHKRLLYIGKATNRDFAHDAFQSAKHLTMPERIAERLEAAKGVFEAESRRKSSTFWGFAQAVSLAIDPSCDDMGNLAWTNVSKPGQSWP